MRSEYGFSLIELVVVIVVLGILSAVAIPLYADIGSDARVSSVKSAAGAMYSGISLVQSAAAVKGVSSGVGVVVVDGVGVATLNGWPASLDELRKAVSVTGLDLVSNQLRVSAAPDPANCGVGYTVGPAGGDVVVSVSGC